MSEPRGGIADLLGGPQRSLILLIAVIVVSGVGIGAIAFALLGTRGDSSTPPMARSQTSGPGQTATETSVAEPRCVDPARVNVTAVNTTRAGLTMAAEFSTPCPDGDTLTGPAVVLAAAQGTRDFASGVFDLNSDPIVLPPNTTVERTLVYPAGSHWRVPELVRNEPMDVAIGGASHSGDETSFAEGSSTLTASAPANPGHGSPDGTAATALQELADYDRGFVTSSLENLWIPQISSKKVGTRDNGIVYANADILRDHLDLRERYQDVKLVSSNDWTTFSEADYWISAVGQPFHTGDLANRWCDTQGIDANNCFAKVISSRFGPDGTTQMRN